ncbi:UNVERIFIED_CONTAM: hypothetical protein K2H54_061594 [Gekko kuhli]
MLLSQISNSHTVLPPSGLGELLHIQHQCLPPSNGPCLVIPFSLQAQEGVCLGTQVFVVPPVSEPPPPLKLAPSFSQPFPLRALPIFSASCPPERPTSAQLRPKTIETKATLFTSEIPVRAAPPPPFPL